MAAAIAAGLSAAGAAYAVAHVGSVELLELHQVVEGLGQAFDVGPVRAEQDPLVEALTDYCQSLFGLNEFIYVD